MRTLAKNKKAYFDYEISQTRQAGIVLSGAEVKACKMDHCSIVEAIILFSTRSGVLEIKGMNIPLYSKASPLHYKGYEPKRSRILILKQQELTRIKSRLSQGGIVLIPLELIELKNRRIKIVIGLAQRRRKVEKRQLLKERDTAKQMQKEIDRL